MTTVNLARGLTDVDIDLLGEGGDLALAHFAGKAERETLSGFKETKITERNGLTDPYPQDNLAGTQGFIIRGKLLGSTAYSDAKDLVTIVRSEDDSSTNMTLDLTNLSGFTSTYTVGAHQQDETLQLEYVPGRVDEVDVTLTLEAVNLVL